MFSRIRRIGWQRRRRYGDEVDPPTFFEHDVDQGYLALPVDFNDWDADRMTDPALQAEIMAVTILGLSSSSLDNLMKSTHVRLQNPIYGDFVYEISGGRRPLSAHDWWLPCAASGVKPEKLKLVT